MKILFITRAYPPIIGGMEKFSYKVTTTVSKLCPSFIIANTKGKKNIPLFLIYAFFKSIYLIWKEKIDVIHLGDPVLSPIGLLLKYIFNKPVIVTLHGLDITLPNRLYQLIIPPILKKFDKYICISSATKDEAIKHGLEATKCAIIPVGIEDNLFLKKPKGIIRKKLEKELNINFKNKIILLSVGHLVKRKGFYWFIKNVLPNLGKNYFYLVIGGFGNQSKGNEKIKIENTIKELGLSNQVILAGKVSDKILRLAYNSADIFIMPNIKVRGDLEGFGMVATEAASCCLPVIASRLEGIKDAIIDKKNGFLVKPEQKEEFIKTISLITKDLNKNKFGKEAREFTIKNYNWESICRNYLNEFTDLLK